MSGNVVQDLMKATWAFGKSAFHFYRRTQHLHGGRPPCRRANRGKGLSAYVPAETIEQRVWQLVDEMLCDPQTLAAAIGATGGEEEQMATLQDDRLRRDELKLERTLRAWDVARRAHFAGDLDVGTYGRDKEHYEREIAML